MGAATTTRSRGSCVGKGFFDRVTPAPFNLGAAGVGGGRIGGDFVFGAIGLKLLKLKFKLVDQTRTALGCLTIALAPQPRDFQLQAFDQHNRRGEARFDISGVGFGVRRVGLGGDRTHRHRSQRCFQTGDVVARFHRARMPRCGALEAPKSAHRFNWPQRL